MRGISAVEANFNSCLHECMCEAKREALEAFSYHLIVYTHNDHREAVLWFKNQLQA